MSSTLIRFELKCVTLSTDKDMANGAAFLKKEIAKGIPMLKVEFSLIKTEPMLGNEFDTDITFILTKNLEDSSAYVINGGMMNDWTKILIRYCKLCKILNF